MSAKDNFAQAMRELLNGAEGESPAAEQPEERTAPASSFSSFSRPARAEEEAEEAAVSEPARYPNLSAPAPQAEEPVPASAPTPAPAPEFRSASAMMNSQPTFSVPPPPAVAPPPPAPTPAPVAPLEAAEVDSNGEATVIAAGTTVLGDITTATGLRVNGNIKGNLKVATLLEMDGKVIGDIEASDVVFNGSVVRGNLNISGSITIDEATTIVGDVTAQNADINGKVKGNMTVEERGRFRQNAVLVGNLMAGTVSVDEGAMLKGDVSIISSQADDSLDDASFDIG